MTPAKIMQEETNTCLNRFPRKTKFIYLGKINLLENIHVTERKNMPAFQASKKLIHVLLGRNAVGILSLNLS